MKHIKTMLFLNFCVSILLSAQTLTVHPQNSEAAIDTLQLSVYLWRDFQPISPPTGKPLRIKVAIRSSHPDILDSLYIEKMMLVHQKDTLVVGGSDIQPLLERLPGELRWVWRKGPLWPPKDMVDVYIYVRTSTGQLTRLEARNQRIHVTF